MSTGPDLDHTSYAVADASTWARRLRRELGAVPIAGEALPEFRYLLLHVGTAEAGGRIELIEPTGSGFVSRFLERRGEGPHHITFTVPDLRATVAQVRRLGLIVVGENYQHPPWMEAFIAPDDLHGIVVQLAQSDTAYPPPSELLASRDRDVESFPSSAGATNKTWWTGVWDTAPARTAVMEATHLVTSDPTRSQRLFSGVLEGEWSDEADGHRIHWPGGEIRLRSGGDPGVTAVTVRGAPGRLTVGNTLIDEVT